MLLWFLRTVSDAACGVRGEWLAQDSDLRGACGAADLQSAPFGLFGSQPWFGIVLRGLFLLRWRLGGRIGLPEDPTRPAFKTGTSVGGLSSGFLLQLNLMQSRYVEHP